MQDEERQVNEMVMRPPQAQMVGTRPQILREVPKNQKKDLELNQRVSVFTQKLEKYLKDKYAPS